MKTEQKSMSMKSSITKLATYCAVLVSPLSLFAQTEEPELSKTIQVYSEYKPQISDAARISVNPKVYDTLDLQVNLKYDVATSPLKTDYHIIPLRAVSVKGDRLQELYKGEATVGLGNYMTGLFSLRYMTERSRLRQSGIEFYHQSSTSKLKRKIGEEKIFAGYTTDYFSAYWKRFYDKFTLYTSIKPEYKNFMRYGYQNIETFDGVVYEKKKIRRNVIGLNANVALVSNDTDVDALRYNADVNYDLSFATNPKNIENLVNLSGGLNKAFGRVVAGFDANYEMSILNFQPEDLDSSQFESVLKVLPYAKVGTDDWSLKVGVNASPILGGNTQFKIFPDIAFAYSLPKVKMVPYFNFYGGVSMMSMKDMLEENPYVSDSIMVKPTINKLGFDLGLSGRIKKLVTYNAEFSVKAYDDMYFWIAERHNPVTLGLTNIPVEDINTTYGVVYDNSMLMKAHADLGFLFRKVNCGIEANYYYWQLDTLSYAWYKPVVDATITSRFSILNPNNSKTKLSIEPSAYFLLYQDETNGDGDIAKSCIFDLGLEANYYYNSVLRVFVDVNNILGLRYHRYVDYPCQRANFLIGLSYSFGGHKE